MRLLLYILFFWSAGVHGQSLTGTIIDKEDYTDIKGAIVTNATTQRTVAADKHGKYSIPASKGDIIFFSAEGYHTLRRIATPSDTMNVYLLPLTGKLPEYTIVEKTEYQQDSTEIAIYYHKELARKPVTVGYSSANGGGFTGLIGAPVHRMSRSYKLNRRFKENVRLDLEQRYIDTKYTPVLVGSLTGLRNDSLILFMNTYPMDYTFARHASDMELKSWIKYNYRSYKQKGR